MASAGIAEAGASISHGKSSSLLTITRKDYTDAELAEFEEVLEQGMVDIIEESLSLAKITTFKSRWSGDRPYWDPTTGKVEVEPCGVVTSDIRKRGRDALLAKWGGNNIHEAITNACSSQYGQTPRERAEAECLRKHGQTLHERAEAKCLRKHGQTLHERGRDALLAKWGGNNIHEALTNACSSLYGQTLHERAFMRWDQEEEEEEEDEGAAVVPAGVSSRGRKRGPPAHFGDYAQHGAQAGEYEEYGAQEPGVGAGEPKLLRSMGVGQRPQQWSASGRLSTQQPAALQGGPGSTRGAFGAQPMGSAAAVAAAAAAAAAGALNARQQQWPWPWQQLQPAALQGGPGSTRGAFGAQPMGSAAAVAAAAAAAAAGALNARQQQWPWPWQQLQPAALQGGPGPMRGAFGAQPMGSAAAAAAVAAAAAAAAAAGALNAQQQQRMWQWQQLQPAALLGGPGPMRGAFGAQPMGSAAAAAAAAVAAAAATGALNARQQQWQWQWQWQWQQLQLQPAAPSGGPGPMRGAFGAQPMGSAAAAAGAATGALGGPGARPSSPYPPDGGADALQPPAKRARVDG
ncbi:hypothetical protein Rsub_02939 [Raphidocelis subcapitata]|uniref:Uncharacterized protein n=1 Tax=Raphidocelis subcapitata TaxID=307507 RepID=A0A2V0NR32_9CHLO|nr:hypothetical protein Rsub_02939 [Raphidocelis subcapitata]|eukprot:GBF89769.1 hypothetical protein Rsub_02939 [Raphidocelis subcapitata]